MATAQFVHDGNSIDFTPSIDVPAGTVVVQADLIGIAKLDIDADSLGALAVTGVFDLPKATGASSAIAVGSEVYWDAVERVAKTDAEAGANKRLGRTVRAATDDDATVRVRLSQ